MIYTINITSMMVLASIYLSVSTSLPRCPSLYLTQTTGILFSTDTIKPVEKWLLFNLGYPFMVIISNIIEQVKHLDLSIFLFHMDVLFLYFRNMPILSNRNKLALLQ